MPKSRLLHAAVNRYDSEDESEEEVEWVYEVDGMRVTGNGFVSIKELEERDKEDRDRTKTETDSAPEKVLDG